MDEGQIHEEESPDNHKKISPFMEAEGDQVEEGVGLRVFNPLASQKEEGKSQPWITTFTVNSIILILFTSKLVSKTNLLKTLLLLLYFNLSYFQFIKTY